MSGLDNCPNCGVSLIGGPIPEDQREHCSPPYHWKREIGMEYPERYDGDWEWMCPDCKHTWPSIVQLLSINEQKMSEDGD